MIELFKFLADNNLSLEAEYRDSDLVVVLSDVDIDFYCAFVPGDANHGELFNNYLYPSLLALNKARQ